jgi:hypothetical protein
MATNVISELVSAGARFDRFGPRLLTDDARTKYETAKAALNAEAKDKFGSEEWHREQAATMAGMLDYQFTFNNLFGSYFLVRNVGMYEKVFVRERRGLKVFYTSRGGYIEESQLRNEDWELPRDTLGFHVSEFEDNLEAGYAETMESMVSLGMARMEAEVNRRMFNLLQEAVPSSSAYYVDATGTGLTAAVLKTAITEVADSIQPNGVAAPPITIIGRSAGVDAISDFTGYAEEALEEIRLKGRLGTYRGANIVRVTNYTDENGESYIPDNEVWVFGGTVGLFAMYGGLKSKTWAENTVDYRHYRCRKDIGGLIHHPEQARRIKIAA